MIKSLSLFRITFNFVLNSKIFFFKRTNQLNEFDPKKLNLINYWPFDGNRVDIVTGKYLTMGQSAFFSNDHNQNENTALDLNNGYVQAPEGIYFNGDFTISAWVMLKKDTKYGRILDFGNGQRSDNIVLSFSDNLTRMVYLYTINESAEKSSIATSALNLNEWYFITACLENNTIKIYLNGSLVLSDQTQIIPRNITRTKNYIGKSNWEGDEMVDGKIDELKIFNRALNASEILNQMESN